MKAIWTTIWNRIMHTEQRDRMDQYASSGYLKWGSIGWKVDADGTLLIRPWKGDSGMMGSMGPPWFRYDRNDDIKAVASTGRITLHRDSGNLFFGCKNLTDLSGVQGWDTSRVKDMSWMFTDCVSLTDLDALGDAGWDTGNVKDMSGMFYGCSGLTDIDGLGKAGWDTRHVTDMSGMFDRCTGLTDIDGLGKAGWDTRHVTDMSRMFYRCESLNDPTGIRGVLAVPGCDDSTPVNVSGIFEGCDMVPTTMDWIIE